MLKERYVHNPCDIQDAFLNSELVHGRRGIGMSTALRGFVHVLHEGNIFLACPSQNLGCQWVDAYRRSYPRDLVPVLVLSHSADRILRGTLKPLYAECWDMLSREFQKECIRYGIVNGVSTF